MTIIRRWAVMAAILSLWGCESTPQSATRQDALAAFTSADAGAAFECCEHDATGCCFYSVACPYHR